MPFNLSLTKEQRPSISAVVVEVPSLFKLLLVPIWLASKDSPEDMWMPLHLSGEPMHDALAALLSLSDAAILTIKINLT